MADLPDPALVRIRHDLHQHPELGFQEVRTQQVIREFLTALGYRPIDSARTGLYADLHPGKQPTIALRADIDCLPIDEKTDLPYRSIHPGRAHKCGHDGHTTILLGTARALMQARDRIEGNVRLIFQPAEEGVEGGGARVMVEEGVLDGVREVYGLHNWPQFEKGAVRVKAGATMAQVHELYVDIEGVGGHGSQPQLCRDPIVAGAQLVSALQTLVSRELGYEGGAVVSICAFNAGNTHNVIPGVAQLKGTIRTFSPAVAERIVGRFHQILDGVMTASGTRARLELIEGYPVLVNDAACAEAVARVGESVVGKSNVSTDGLPIAGGEDFAYFTRTIPGAYFFLGAKKPNGETPCCHHPDFDFDDDLIPIGIRMFLGLVQDRLRR
jgi:amidohydrolase